MESKRFIKPGKDNKEDRENFVRFWANYIKNVGDQVWSKQQNIIINSQIHNSKEFYKDLIKTERGREILKKINEKMLELDMGKEL